MFLQGSMKTEVMADMNKYVVRDAQLPLLLDRMRKNGFKTFLLTNSGYEFSNVSFTFVLLVNLDVIYKISIFFIFLCEQQY